MTRLALPNRRVHSGGDWLAACYEEHRLLLLTALSYMGVGGVFLALAERPWPLRLTTPLFGMLSAGVTAAWFAYHWRQPPQRRGEGLARVPGAVLVLLIAVPTQVTFQSLKQSIGPFAGFPWDGLLHRIDVAIHGGPAWQRLGWLVNPEVVRWIDALYMAWFPILFATVIWLAWSQKRRVRQQGLLALLLLWIVGGTLLAAVFASAGPCYSTEPAYVELVRRLDAMGPTWARVNQTSLWAMHRDDVWAPFGGISAMPSLHVAFAVLLACIAWQRARFLGVLCWCYAGIVQVGSVLLAWHYAIDGYAGAFIAWGCWSAAGRCLSSPGQALKKMTPDPMWRGMV